MKKNLLKSIAMLAMSTSMVVLGSCGSNTSVSSGNDSTSSSSETELYVGIMLYNYTDIQGKSIKSYCNYLSENLPIKFEYQSIGTSDDDAVSGCEALIAKGVDAIITGYDSAIQTVIQDCNDAGVYLNIGLYQAEESDYSGLDTTHFLYGNTQFDGDAQAIGVAYAQKAYESGLKHIGAITFPEFSFPEGVEIYDAFKTEMATLDPECEVYDLQSFMFTQDAAEQEVVKLKADHPDCDGVLGLGSGLDYILPAMESNDLNAKLLSLGYNDTVSSEMEAGTVLASGTNNYAEAIAGSVARIFNAVDGKQYSDYPTDQSEMNLLNDYPTMFDTQDVSDFNYYCNPTDDWSHGPVTADELKDVILRYNSDATWASLKTLVSRTMSDIKTARD
jgi:ABC-type sugar transport system substrate-binding protein